MHTYQEASDYLGKKDYRPLTGRGTRLVRLDSGCIAVEYHETNVVTYFDNGSVMLNSGGWKTSTTKARFDEYGPRGWRVYQEKGSWYLINYADNGWDKENRMVYKDGVVLHPDGVAEGFGTEPDKGLVKRIAKYATDYAAAFTSGQVESPSGGDCFYCSMVDVATGKPFGGTDHLESHMEEGYYVPSLLVNAIKEFPVCQLTMGSIGELWYRDNQLSDYFAKIAQDDIKKSIRKYMRRQFGFAN